MTVCICGSGALGHVIAGWLAAKGKAEVNILSSKPELWQNPLRIHRPEGEVIGIRYGHSDRYLRVDMSDELD